METGFERAGRVRSPYRRHRRRAYFHRTVLAGAAGLPARHGTRVLSSSRTQTRRECPEIDWKAGHIIPAPTDHVDVFTAPDNATVAGRATIVRTFGHAATEIRDATERERFSELAGDLPPAPTADD